MEPNQGSLAKAVEIAYVRFSLPNLKKMEEFLPTFGMTPIRQKSAEGQEVLYGKGYGGGPYIYHATEGEQKFLGLGFEVASMAELEKLATAEGASEIESVKDPGGGYRVRFTDPNGYEIDAIYGRLYSDPEHTEQRVPFNWASNRRRMSEPVRLKPGPAPVRRLGHCVLNVLDFRESENWYKERFGFLTSDEIHREEKTEIMGAFLRCDKGDVPADHHTIFLMGTGNVGVNHIAFEVEDWDTLMLGHSFLEKHGYEKYWGIGKHILGSQVFDYWKDPFGYVLEHYTDGDVFDASVPPALQSRETLLGVQWGTATPHSKGTA
ncbi:MAG: VOC family protein [Pseudomonadota bacterium]